MGCNIVDIDKRTIGERIDEYVTTMGIRLVQLSKSTGINYNTLIAYRMGRATPGMTNLRLLVDGTGLSADYWIGTDRRDSPWTNALQRRKRSASKPIFTNEQ